MLLYPHDRSLAIFVESYSVCPFHDWLIHLAYASKTHPHANTCQHKHSSVNIEHILATSGHHDCFHIWVMEILLLLAVATQISVWAPALTSSVYLSKSWGYIYICTRCFWFCYTELLATSFMLSSRAQHSNFLKSLTTLSSLLLLSEVHYSLGSHVSDAFWW